MWNRGLADAKRREDVGLEGADQLLVREACDQAEVNYTTAFVGDQLAVLSEALRLRYLCLAERAVSSGMKIARDYFLPKLPTMHAGIYKYCDLGDEKFDAVIDCIGQMFDPNQVQPHA